MSVKDLNSLNPLIRRIKKTVRFWFFTLTYGWVGFIGCCLWASGGSGAIPAAAAAVVHFFILFVLYLKNHNRNLLLKSTLKDFENVKKVSLLLDSYKSMCFWIGAIFPLDIFLWPVLMPVKFIFWISYRRFRRRIKKLKKLIEEGTVVLQRDEIESDPFYSFLMREGLYERPGEKAGLENFLEEEFEEEEPKDNEEPEENNEETPASEEEQPQQPTDEIPIDTVDNKEE